MWRSLAHEPYRFKISLLFIYKPILWQTRRAFVALRMNSNKSSKNNISSMDSSSINSSFPRYKTCTIVSISDFCKNVKFLLIFCLFAVQCPLYFVHIVQFVMSFLTFIRVFAQMQAFGLMLHLLARLKDEDHVSMREFH